MDLYFYGYLKIASGSIIADVSDIHSNIDVSFGTQPAIHDEKTGMPKDSEMAPAVTLSVLQLDIDSHKSKISVEGFFLSYFYDMILALFDKQIFTKIIDETKTYIESTLDEEANKYLLEHGTHYYRDGLGFDYSLTRPPTVTDDSLLTFCMKGTFYGDKAPLVPTV